MIPLKRVTSINERNLSENTEADYRFRYVDVAAVSEGEVSVPEEDTTFATAPSRARRVAAPGDVLVSTVRTYLRAVAAVPTVDRLIFSTGLAVLSARPGTDPRFLSYACRSDKFLQQVEAQSTGVSYPAISPTELGDVSVPLPPIEEQRRIADFLDSRLAWLEEVVRVRRKGLTLVRARHRAQIRDILAFGTSSDTESEKQGIGSSRVPWLDRQPVDWKAAPLRYLATIQRGASPRPIDDPAYFEDNGSHAWVRISDVTASTKYLRETSQRMSELGRSFSVSLDPGELFVSIAGTVGKPIITQIPCCIHDGFVAIRKPRIHPELLYSILLLGDCFQGLGKLGTQLNLNTDTVGSITVPLPPVAEQATLVSLLNEAMVETGTLQERLIRQEQLLAERRQSLITAAVTGDIDVTTARRVA
jgi:type I restriction enzyme S subunit